MTLGVLLSPGAIAATVVVKDGNIFLIDRGPNTQLTSSGHDSQATLSPDGKVVAFVRTDESKAIAQAAWGGDIHAAQILTMPSAGGKTNPMISAGDPCGENKFLGDFNSLAFLSDSRRLVFQSSWAAVHGSTHIIDVQTSKCTLVAGGLTFSIVKSGEYRDHLLVMLHKYFLAGGSYDWYWLVDSSGKEIGPVGEDEQALELFREMYER